MRIIVTDDEEYEDTSEDTESVKSDEAKREFK